MKRLPVPLSLSAAAARALLSGLLAAGLAGCGDTAQPPAPKPAVTVTGRYSVEIGKTVALSAITTGGSDAAYTWKSSDEAIATVDQTGTVSGVAAGEATITATGGTTGAGGTHGVVVIAPVTPPMPSPEVVISGEFVLLTNATTKLAATTVNGTDAGYDWVSSDARVATVDGDGNVKGVAPGKVTLTATGKNTGRSGSYNMVVANDVPHLVEWLSSGHADVTSGAFNEWNGTMPPAVPTACARCHSTPGFQDYLGADGTAMFMVDNPAAIGTVVECKACHNQVAATLSQVTFPSGVTLKGLGPEARCMTCHQGREATDTVNATIATAAAADDDTVSSKLGFKNIHYFAAGATLEAGRVRGGYQYAGKVYDWRFRHVPGFDTCVGCHDPHTLARRITATPSQAGCDKCHAGVTKDDDLKNIRMMSSLSNDYDGDGDLTEGIFYEIAGLRARLLQAIQAYVLAKGLPAICYSPVAYPYFFIDTDGDGSCSVAEGAAANKYASWTNRLLRASYNYQVSIKDPGAFAHNAKYIIELLYDSTADVNLALVNQIDLSNCVRNDTGHFNGAGAPARSWDANDAVDVTCSRCHAGSAGLRFFQQYGVGTGGIEPDNGLDCYTCHDGFGTQPSDFTRFQPTQAIFPSGIVVKPDAKVNADSFLCLNCHVGREAKSTIDAGIAAAVAANKAPSFRNIHSMPGGSTLYGHDAQVGYEYTGKTYAARRTHVGGISCNDCHSGKNTRHTFQVTDNLAACQVCHASATALEDIRMLHQGDYDGDGSSTESLADELRGLADAVLAEMNTAGGANPICYSGKAFPNFFKATRTAGGGPCDPADAVFANSYKNWTAALVKAGHNYRMSQKDPGAWAHNFSYMAELLIDSVEDLGGSVAGFSRP